MNDHTFYRNNKMSITLEEIIKKFNSFEEFEREFSDEFLNLDNQIGDYLSELLYKYDKKASVVSIDAKQSASYLGNIINGRKNNPRRDVLICICLTIGTTFDEVQYLLKYAGKNPLYVRNKRDVIIWFGFMKHENLDTVNSNLVNRGLTPLYKDQ